MNEGWLGDDYLILFDESEVALASERYAISTLLPGYQVIGLRGWDDLILRDGVAHTYLAPTVPAIHQYLSKFRIPGKTPTLHPDERYREKIKWYVKPIIFGGDPKDEKNLSWVSHELHAQLVQWWNNMYRELEASSNEERDASILEQSVFEKPLE